MARATYPPKNAPLIAKDSKGAIIPLYCHVEYQGQSYEVVGYYRGNGVWLRPVGGFRKIQVEGSLLFLTGLNEDKCLKAKNTKYSQWELDKAAARCYPGK